MFFGLEVKSNQSKPIILQNTTKLSQAVLEPSKNGKKDPVSLIAEYNKKQFILCVLDPSLSWQCPLDLLFEGGAEVKFSLRGTGTVHLTGYEPPDDFDDMNYSISSVSSSEDEEMEVTPSKAKKALTNGTGSATKSPQNLQGKRKAAIKAAAVPDTGDDDDDDDDEDFSYDSSEDDFELIKQGMEGSSDEDSDLDDDDEDDDGDDDDEDDDDDDEEEDDCQIEEMSEDSD